MSPARATFFLASSAALAGCLAMEKSEIAPVAKLHADLGVYQRPASTSSAEAQRYFDQGLLLAYAFNHEEALRSFERASELDPGFAMACWGAALVRGPHINNPTMDEAASRAAAAAVARAKSLATEATPLVERDLIAALAMRYADPPPADRATLDAAYADAMREVWRRHPEDADVGALFAESLMDLRPWDQWTKDGTPQPGTEEVLATLAKVLELDPDHPAGLHLTIHAWEASKTPERALPAADLLRHRVPGAGHLVHMPSHIDMRLGRYEEAILANERAVAADRRYVQHAGRLNFFSMYRAHDYHMLAWACMYDGQIEKAIAAARELVREMPAELVDRMPDALEAFLAAPYHVLVRFGRWNEILAEPVPPPNRPICRAFRRYARAMAYSAQGRVEEATDELEQFEGAARLVPETATFGNNPMSSLFEVARTLARGEIEYRRGNVDRAFELLREAVVLEEALKYDEPWGWMQPVRHALGALLVEQGRIDEAEAVYRADLVAHPDNGWSLHGLAECLRRQGRDSYAETVEAAFRRAWARADFPLESSCFCRTASRDVSVMHFRSVPECEEEYE